MVSPDGAVAKGRFDLSRPGKLRFDYTDPKGNQLIADGDYIIFWDAQQKEASNEPISETPASFLLKPHISLTDGVKVANYEHAAGMIRVTLVEEKDPGAGAVTIAFADQPLELRAWRIADPQGQVTDVTFSNWRFGLSLDPGLFHFRDPKAGIRHR
jgi:outer membrane lipoprotein-sorting protein